MDVRIHFASGNTERFFGGKNVRVSAHYLIEDGWVKIFHYDGDVEVTTFVKAQDVYRIDTIVGDKDEA